MSIFDELNFDAWIKAAYRETSGFTALVILVRISADRVDAMSSTYVHLIGDELTWPEFAGLLRKSGKAWDGVVIFTETDKGHGPIPDVLAKLRLKEMEEWIFDDRLRINEGHFFDVFGRRMQVEETPRQNALNS